VARVRRPPSVAREWAQMREVVRGGSSSVLSRGPARSSLWRSGSAASSATSWWSGVAYHVARRPLLQGEDRPWLDKWRRRLEDLHLRGLECLAQARLGLGGPTLPQAEDAARRLPASVR
jgi:hypothetical protein